MEKGSAYHAARKLGIAYQNIYAELDKLVLRASQRGWTEHSDNTRFVPPGQQLVGQSTLTKDEEGNTVWIKTKAEFEQKQQAFKPSSPSKQSPSQRK